MFTVQMHDYNWWFKDEPSKCIHLVMLSFNDIRSVTLEWRTKKSLVDRLEIVTFVKNVAPTKRHENITLSIII